MSLISMENRKKEMIKYVPLFAFFFFFFDQLQFENQNNARNWLPN